MSTQIPQDDSPQPSDTLEPADPLNLEGGQEPYTPPKPIELLGVSPEEAAQGIESFKDLPLVSGVLEGISGLGWTSPTPVQKLCLPFTLRGRDVAGFAQTGTGKTGVFLLTIANKLALLREKEKGDEPKKIKAVVLCPTRELAIQIEQDAAPLLSSFNFQSLAVYGGVDYEVQASKVQKGVDMIFATPGRLKDYVQKGVVELGHLELFVCDEADRMFDMGFVEDVEFFLEKIPETCQRLLFSATTNDQVKELAFEYLETPEYISVTPETVTPERIEQVFYHCHAVQKLRVMLGLLRDQKPECAIIFTNTKLTAEWLHFKLLHNGIEADLITGDLPQKKRIALISRIKEGKLKALIATDVVSRGLHISRVSHVYNFDIPEEPANYVHRIGRTARAGAKGTAVSLVCDDYGQNLQDVYDLLGPSFVPGTSWPPAEYDAIQDQAGNPFQDRYDQHEAWKEQKRAERKEAQTRRQGARGTKDGPRDSYQGGRDRFREGKDFKKEGRYEGSKRHSDHKTHQGRGPDERFRKDQGKEYSKDYGKDKGRDRDRRYRDDKDHRHKGRKEDPKQTQSRPQQAVETHAPKGLWAMIKELFKALFGKRTKK